MAASLVAQINVASNIMSSMPGNELGINRVATAQRIQLQEQFRKAKTSIVGISDIMTAIDASSFPQLDKDAMKDVLTKCNVVGGITESKFQNWESLMAFPSSSMVAAKGTGAFTTKTLHLYLRMGLRDPSEKTFRALADLISIGTQGMEKAMTMNSDQRQAALDSVKALFRNAVNGLPPSDLALLPSTPEDLQVAYPEAYDRAYSTDPPGVLEIDPLNLQLFRGPGRCRKEKASRVLTVVQPAVPNIQRELAVGMNMMMERMSSMFVDNRPRIDIFRDGDNRDRNQYTNAPITDAPRQSQLEAPPGPREQKQTCHDSKAMLDKVSSEIDDAMAAKKENTGRNQEKAGRS